MGHAGGRDRLGDGVPGNGGLYRGLREDFGWGPVGCRGRGASGDAGPGASRARGKDSGDDGVSVDPEVAAFGDD